VGDRGGYGERGVGLKKAGSTDKGLFGLGTLSAAFWGWVEEVGWWVSKADRAASYTARVRSGQEAGVGAGPESHGRGLDGSLGVAVSGDIVKKAVSRGKVVLGGIGLVRGKLTNSGEYREI
jgi:hypothetical protein